MSSKLLQDRPTEDKPARLSVLLDFFWSCNKRPKQRLAEQDFTYSPSLYVKTLVEGLFPENIIPRKVPCKHWSKSFLEFLHAFCTPTHSQKKLTPFLCVSTNVLQLEHINRIRCMCFDQCVATGTHSSKFPSLEVFFLIWRCFL